MAKHVEDQTKIIDKILSIVPTEFRKALEHLRSVIAAEVPDAIQTLSYGVPAFYYNGRPLLSYGAAKTHCALYVMNPVIMQTFEKELKDFDSSKGTIRFSPEKPIPDSLIKRIAKEKVKLIDSK